MYAFSSAEVQAESVQACIRHLHLGGSSLGPLRQNEGEQERRVTAVLGPVVIYCYTAPVRSCIDNESHHSKTESDENARNATQLYKQQGAFAPSERSSRGTCHTAGWKSCSASVRIQTPAAVPSSLHSFVNVTAVDTERME